MQAITDGRVENGAWQVETEPASRRRWPVWFLVLVLCAAPIALPLAVGGVALAGGVLLGLLTLIVGAGVAGVLSVGAGAVASVVGFAGLFVHGVGWGLHYMAGGVVSSLFGVLMLSLFAVGAFLCWKTAVWLLRRRRGVC